MERDKQSRQDEKRMMGFLNRFVNRTDADRLRTINDELSEDLKVEKPTIEQERNMGVRMFTIEDELNRTSCAEFGGGPRKDEEEEILKKLNRKKKGGNNQMS